MTMLDSTLTRLHQVLGRFPVPVLVAAATASLLLVRLFELPVGDWPKLLLDDFDFWLSLGAAFLLAVATVLFAETRLPPLPVLGLSVIVAIAGAAIVLRPDVTHVSLILAFCGAGLAVLLAPFATRQADPASVWWFAAKTTTGALLAFLGGGILLLGLVAIGEAVELLVPGNWNSNRTINTFSVSAPIIFGFLVPVAWLSHVPQRADAPKPGLGVTGPVLIALWVVAPVLAVYALVLHAYAVRILMLGALPVGQLGSMVSIYGLVGTVTFLVLQQERARGQPVAKLFCKAWFPALIVPLILLVLATLSRIGAYDLSASRVLLLLLAVWFAVLIALFAPRLGRGDIRLIPASLLVLCVLFAAGPYGIVEIGNRAQAGRLVALLEQNGVVRDGKVVAGAGEKLPPSVADEIVSTTRYLGENGGLDRLASLFEGQPKNPFEKERPEWQTVQYALTGPLLRDRPDWLKGSDSVRVASGPAVILGGPVRVLGPFSLSAGEVNWQADGIGITRIANVLTLTDADTRAQFDLANAVQAAAPKPEGDTASNDVRPSIAPVRIEGVLGATPATLVLIGGTLEPASGGNAAAYSGGTFFVVLGATPGAR